MFADLAADVALIFLAVYAAHLVAYFGLGGALVAVNRRHPDRRLQPKRRGETHAAREIRASLIALVPISLLMAAGLGLQAHGFGLFPPLEISGLGWIGLLAATLLIYDAWFYWAHRLMHTRPLYRFHRLHHRSVAPTVWSNYSDHPVDAVVHQLFLLIAPLLLPVPPSVLIAHRLIDHVNGQIGHSGFEYFAGPGARLPWPGLCTAFHDDHHARFTCNYGNFLSIWDRIMGTISADYDARVRSLERPQTVRGSKG